MGHWGQRTETLVSVLGPLLPGWPLSQATAPTGQPSGAADALSPCATRIPGSRQPLPISPNLTHARKLPFHRTLLWLDRVPLPPKILHWIPNSSTSEWDRIWGQGLYGGDEGDMVAVI